MKTNRSRPPQFLYKYRSYSAIDGEFVEGIIRYGEFYCAHPESFNDPFDCCIPMRVRQTADDLRAVVGEQVRQSIVDALAELARNGHRETIWYRQKEARLRRVEAGQDEYVSDTAARIAADGVRATDWDSPPGILSLTEDPANVLMWSHYAANHTGIAVRIDTSKLAVEQQVQIRRVKYRRTYPKLTYTFRSQASLDRSALRATLNMCLLQLSDHAMRGILYKSSDWKYEKEWRLIAKSVGPLKLHREAIVGVIFGCRCPDRVRRRLTDIVSRLERCESICLYEAIQSKDGFRVEIVPFEP